MSQLLLPLDFRRGSDPARIVVGSANAHVAEALRDPTTWPYRTALLKGPPRAGKSLLGRWFAAQGKGEVIDGADSWDEAELFHRWNRAQESGEALLLIVDAPDWDVALPDLASRMGGSLQLAIGQADDAMMADLLESHAAQRGLALGEGAMAYLVPRMGRSFAEIERLVAEIDRLSLERKVPATLSVWRDALEVMQGPEQARLL